MGNLDDLIRQLDTASGEDLYRVIREIGGLGAEARSAVYPLLNLVRHDDDPRAQGHAILAVGLIRPDRLSSAVGLSEVADEEKSHREFAATLDAEGAARVASRLLEEPIQALDEFDPTDLIGSRSRKLVQIALRHPAVVHQMVKALAGENALGHEELIWALGRVGERDPEVIVLLEPLFEHESAPVRDAALSAAAGTERMPRERFPSLIRALQAGDGLPDELEHAVNFLVESDPRDMIWALISTSGADGLDHLDYSPPYLLTDSAIEVVVEELIRLLELPAPDIRRKATAYLGWIGGGTARAVECLRKLFDDDDPIVGDAARAEIAQIERRNRRPG